MGQPVDEFWSAIYTVTGVDPATVPAVESLVESTIIRFYINCGIIAYRPKLGICQEWARAFSVMVRDAAFQSSACADPLHRVFLHQAVLSAVVLARTRQAELRLLPILPTYLSFQEIADGLSVSRNTVKTQALSIYGKLQASSRGEAVERAVELGLLEPFPVVEAIRRAR